MNTDFLKYSSFNTLLGLKVLRLFKKFKMEKKKALGIKLFFFL